jgi:hypothetical protein
MVGGMRKRVTCFRIVGDRRSSATQRGSERAHLHIRRLGRLGRASSWAVRDRHDAKIKNRHTSMLGFALAEICKVLIGRKPSFSHQEVFFRRYRDSGFGDAKLHASFIILLKVPVLRRSM